MATDKMNFVQLLQATRRGEIVREADDMLAEMIGAIHEFGGKGDLTLKLSIKKNDAEQLEITPSLKLNRPRRALGIAARGNRRVRLHERLGGQMHPAPRTRPRLAGTLDGRQPRYHRNLAVRPAPSLPRPK